MTIHLIGFGMNCPDTLTLQGLRALEQADLILGSPRLLTQLPSTVTAQTAAAETAAIVAEYAKSNKYQKIAVIYSGDLGFYSGAALLAKELPDAEIHRIPGISSVQYFAAALNRPWQGWHLVSGHGRAINPVAEVSAHKETFFLTDKKNTPTDICNLLCEAGLGDTKIYVGENLGSENERISCATAEVLKGTVFSALSVVLACRSSILSELFPNGLPDTVFEREEGIPLTKQEVRAQLIRKLCPNAEDVVWDIGCGTGGVTAELAAAAWKGHIYAVDIKAEACALTKRNCYSFGLHNVSVVHGQAPEVLAELPKPDLVFVGGSTGKLSDILVFLQDKAPKARIGLTAIALETLAMSITALKDYGYNFEITQISAARSSLAGSVHMLKAQNPIFIVTGEK